MQRPNPILPSLAVLLFIVAAGCISMAQTGDTQAEHFQRTFALKPGGTLNVENYKGAIRVTGTEAAQATVTVDRVFEGSDRDRAWWLSQNHVNFQSDPGELRINVQYPNNSCFFGDCDHNDYTAYVELTIQVPRQTNLDVNGYKPEMRISNLQGDIRIRSYKSPIEISSTTGSIRIDTYKENVNLKNVAIRGQLYLKNYKADAVIEAKSLGSDVDLESDKGSIVLRVPQNTGMDVDYSGGRRSSFHTDFNMNVANSYPPESVRGKINSGETRVRLRTTKGSVSLEKSSL